MANVICCVSSTAPTRELAALIGETLVCERFAACAQIGGKITSYYVWEGEFHAEDEYPISLKTTEAALPKLKERFLMLHTYKCPQWIVSREETSESYADWAEKSCSPVAAPKPPIL